MKKNIIAFAGSNSKNSINKDLVVYASSLVDNASATVLDLNDFELPLYGIDLEQEQGIPENAHKFLNLIKESDGIILSLAEHNGAYSVAFKNLFDWLTRIDGNMFFNKPMLLMATSTGGRGGLTVLDIAQGRFPYHDAKIIEVFSLPFFKNNFSDGKITNDDFNTQLKNAVEQFKKAL
jgi:chromate reductase